MLTFLNEARKISFHFSGNAFREEQVKDLKEALRGTDPDIPLVFVSGNHDLGNTPTPDTVGGVLCLVLNSQFFFDSSGCPELMEAHEVWLESQLQRAIKTPSRHVLVFQHIPLFLRTPDEEDDYFNLQRGIRERLIQRFKQAGEKKTLEPYTSNKTSCKCSYLIS
ncbi:hypothetical protein PO909_012856 [Leuciscus waleckii]